jgi:hypothetical protein
VAITQYFDIRFVDHSIGDTHFADGNGRLFM